ncbi:MAG TPA: DUF4838 domain-containing protein [bacterium]|nr:DUF4838 domain-containing protein [bacterium]
MKGKLFIGVMGIFLLFCAFVSAEITIVEKGVPKATIIISKDAIGVPTEPTEQTFWSPQPAQNKIAAAVKDLQVYIEKMSGAKIPVVADDQEVSGNLILVGRSKYTKQFDKKIPSGLTPTRDEEGFVIICQANTLLLAGNDEPYYHGTEYAVSNFLHRLGVRWYMPGEYGEFVPKKDTITIQNLNISSKPDFKMRNWWGPLASDLKFQEYRWKIRNMMNPILDFVTIPRDSSIRSVLPPASEVNNPEYAEIFGKDEKGNPNPGMPNLTSEKSVKYAAEKIKEYFRKNPEITSYGIGADDGYPRDYSPETLKRNIGFPDTGGRVGVASDMSITEEWMEWIQAVAKEVYKEFPDHIITTNGYANRNVPPQGIVPDPKIWIMFAAIWCDTIHSYDNPLSWQTLRQAEMIRQWASMYKNVYMYNYMYYMLAGCGAPIPLSHKHMHDMPLYKKWGVVGFSNEGRTIRLESGIFPTYLYARMMWDVNLNAKALMDEFFTNWYGPASKPAKAFWEELEITMETTPWLGHEDRILPYVYSDQLINNLEKHIKDAEFLSTQQPYKDHVFADRVVLENLKAFMAMHKAEFEANFGEAAKQAQRMLEVRAQASKFSRFYFDPNPARNMDDVGYYYWGSAARMAYYKKLADMTTGKTGEMIVVLPEKAKFSIDPRDDGRYMGWYLPEFNDNEWKTILTTIPFYGQGYRDQQGYPYMGAIWYRLEVNVPSSAKNKKIFLYAPAVETEAWIWVNGRFIGHRPYRDAYERPNEINMDVSDAIQPGRKNIIAIRVHTGFNAAQQSAGLTSRLFMYSPK